MRGLSVQLWGPNEPKSDTAERKTLNRKVERKLNRDPYTVNNNHIIGPPIPILMQLDTKCIAKYIRMTQKHEIMRRWAENPNNSTPNRAKPRFAKAEKFIIRSRKKTKR